MPFPGANRTPILRRGKRGKPAIRLSMRACASSGTRATCTIGCAWSSHRSSPSTCAFTGVTARTGSGTHWSTPMSPTTPPTGNGSRAAGRTRRPISGSSTPYCRAKSSTRTAPTCAGGCPSWTSCPQSTSISPGRRRHLLQKMQNSSWAPLILPRSSTHAKARQAALDAYGSLKR